MLKYSQYEKLGTNKSQQGIKSRISVKAFGPVSGDHQPD